MRSGVNTGPARLRITARSSASINTKTSATTKMKMFRQNFSRIFPRESQKTCGSKNASLMAGQPEEFTTARPSAVKNTTVLTTAIHTPRAPSPRSGARIFEPRSPVGGVYGPPGRPWYFSGAPAVPKLTTRLAQDRRVRLVGEPLLLDRVQRPVGLHLPEREVHARHERAPGLEHHPEVLVGLGPELPHDDALLDLDRRHEERGRQVDDDAVDVAVVEIGHRLREVVVDGGLLRRRLDHLGDHVQARGPDRGAELRVLQLVDRGRGRDRAPLGRDQRLVHVVVGLAEVDRVVSAGLVRDLLEHEVEVLLPRREGLVERHRHEGHLVGEGEPEATRDLRRDGALVTLTEGRLVERELGAFDLAALPPRRERRVAGADRERARRLERGGVVGRAGGGGRGRGRAGRASLGGGTGGASLGGRTADGRLVLGAGGEQQPADDEDGEELPHLRSPLVVPMDAARPFAEPSTGPFVARLLPARLPREEPGCKDQAGEPPQVDPGR